jgi:hypothetical protein
VVHQIFHGFGRDGAFLAGFADAGQKFFAGKFLVPSVALADHKPFVFDFFVSGEAVAALGTFAATADRRAFTRGARVYNFVFLTTALGATHKTTANGGCIFVAHHDLGCQGKPKIKANASCLRGFSG